ncbi:Rid family detoxifying hydrolase [Cupriavidus basilensis]
MLLVDYVSHWTTSFEQEIFSLCRKFPHFVLTTHRPRLAPTLKAYVSAIWCSCSGQLPIEPVSGEIPADVEAQTRQSLSNLAAVLEAGGASLASVVKTTVFLKDMDQFALMNAVYQQFFGDSVPARSTIEVARLPRDVLVEIEAIAGVLPKQE